MSRWTRRAIMQAGLAAGAWPLFAAERAADSLEALAHAKGMRFGTSLSGRACSDHQPHRAAPHKPSDTTSSAAPPTRRRAKPRSAVPIRERWVLGFDDGGDCSVNPRNAGSACDEIMGLCRTLFCSTVAEEPAGKRHEFSHVRGSRRRVWDNRGGSPRSGLDPPSHAWGECGKDRSQKNEFAPVTDTRQDPPSGVSGTFTAHTPEALAEAVFAARQGDPVTGRRAGGDAVILGVVSAVEPLAGAELATRTAAIDAALVESLERDQLDYFGRALEQVYGAAVNQDMIASVFDRIGQSGAN